MFIVVWFTDGYRDNGEPILKPGSWIGFTLNQDGKILETTPGA